MFYGEERNDGLLRGARAERIQQLAALKDGAWSIDTILELHCGLLDHAHDVREAAMDALLDFASKHPVPLAVTPVKLLAYFMHAFTVSSGIDMDVVRCLVGLHTAEADGVLKDLLQSGSGSNEQFRRWLESLKAANRHDILRQICNDKLSSGRKKMLKHVLEP
jgi:hypothetical protein